MGAGIVHVCMMQIIANIYYMYHIDVWLTLCVCITNAIALRHAARNTIYFRLAFNKPPELRTPQSEQKRRRAERKKQNKYSAHMNGMEWNCLFIAKMPPHHFRIRIDDRNVDHCLHSALHRMQGMKASRKMQITLAIRLQSHAIQFE